MNNIMNHYKGRTIQKQYTDNPFDFYYSKFCLCDYVEKLTCEHKKHLIFNKNYFGHYDYTYNLYYNNDDREYFMYIYNENEDYCIKECNPVFAWAFKLQTHYFTFPYRTVEENVEWLYTVNDFTILKDAPEEFRCYFPKYILDEVDYKIINI